MTSAARLNPALQAANQARGNDAQRFMSLLLRSSSAKIGLFLVLLVIVCAFFAEQIAPFGPTEGELLTAKLPPAWQVEGSWTHPFGTDQLGQDVFSRVIYGARVSLLVSFFGVFLSLSIGLSFGILAGYLEGWVDSVISSVVNVLLAVPYLVLVIVVATIFGRSLVNVILIFGVTSSPLFVRLVRAEVLRIKQQEFVEAARSLGANDLRLMFTHILPNLVGPLITLATVEMTAMIFYEAGLSFVGLSVPPSVPSWGNMLTLGRRFLTIYPWIALFPGLAIAMTALGFNLLGDALRLALDPRLHQMTEQRR